MELKTHDPTSLRKPGGGVIAGVLAVSVVTIAGGVFGGIGTYSNVKAELGRGETAVGLVAAGEGLTVLLALCMAVLAMLEQTAPKVVRIGMWATPLAAVAVGLAVADDGTELVVYSVAPLAMCGAGEILGLIARRVVAYRTGVDVEAQRKAAQLVQRIAYQHARSANHPTRLVRWYSQRAAWRLAGRVSAGEAALSTALLDVQHDQLRDGARIALADMYAVPAAAPALTAAGGAELPALPAALTDAESAATDAGSGAESPAPPASKGEAEFPTPRSSAGGAELSDLGTQAASQGDAETPEEAAVEPPVEDDAELAAGPAATDVESPVEDDTDGARSAGRPRRCRTRRYTRPRSKSSAAWGRPARSASSAPRCARPATPARTPA
ncbi:hypothetical protein [Streptomyces globosus]|uniref:hypothetical protein n=1 Tax=Streptomyces globosus TaxID=68209 RepID=UPI003632F442